MHSNRLVEMAHHDDEARSALEQLARNEHAQIRFRVASSMKHNPPRPLACHLLHQALFDECSRVRTQAAEVCSKLKLREMLPDLYRRMDLETDPDAFQAILLAILHMEN